MNTVKRAAARANASSQPGAYMNGFFAGRRAGDTDTHTHVRALILADRAAEAAGYLEGLASLREDPVDVWQAAWRREQRAIKARIRQRAASREAA